MKIDFGQMAQMLSMMQPVADKQNPLAQDVNPMNSLTEGGRAYEGTAYPARTADTMGDAISISSPNGRVSGRAQRAAQQRLSEALFGPGGLQRGKVAQPLQSVSLRRQAADLRDMAARGMSVRKFTKEADALEAQAAELEASGN